MKKFIMAILSLIFIAACTTPQTSGTTIAVNEGNLVKDRIINEINKAQGG